MALTTDQGIDLPDGPDLANVPVSFVNAVVAALESRLNLRYANAADRLARHAVGTEGECSDLAAENFADSFDGTNWISRTARGYRAYRVRTTDAAAINNSIAPVADAILTAPIAAAGTFIFGGTMFYDAATAADMRLAFTWPGAPTTSRWGGVGRNATTQTNVDTPVSTVSGTAIAFGANGVGTGCLLHYSGILVNTGLAGNLVASYAQQVADPTDLRVRGGSTLWVLQVA